MLKLADFSEMTDEEVIEHIVSEYADDGYEGYGRTGNKVSEDEIRKALEKYELCVVYEHVGSWGCDSSSFFLMRNKETGAYAWNEGGHCSCYGFEGQFTPEEMPDEWFLRDDMYISTGGYDDDSDGNETLVKNWIKTHIGGGFDTEDPELWTTVLNCLSDDEDGAGYLFDHFKSIEDKIRKRFGA